MFCRNCGKQIPDEAVACPFCGQGMAAAVPAQTVESHMVEAILATLFCCMPFGVVAIVYAAQVSSLVSAGNVVGAQQASQKAHKWAMVALISSLGIGAIYLIIILNYCFRLF